jgi:hypothetical protein
MIGVINLVQPVGLVAKTDPGIVAIERFFEELTRKEWDKALALIHPDRIAEIRKVSPDFSREALRSLYEPLVGYDNLKVKTAAEEGVKARTYSVSVDAEELWPRSSFFVKLQTQRLHEAVRDGLIDEEKTVSTILEDLRAHYEIPEELVPQVRRVLLTRKWRAIFSPAFTYELQRDLTNEARLKVRPKENQATPIQARRHFVFNLRVANDEGQWRIRAGLSNPGLVAPHDAPWAR